MSKTDLLIPLLLALTAAALPTRDLRRLAAASPLVTALALASLRVVGTQGGLMPLPGSYLAITGGLLLAGLFPLVRGLWLAARNPEWIGPQRTLAWIGAVAAAGVTLVQAWPLILGGGPERSVPAVLGISLGGMLLIVAAGKLPEIWRVASTAGSTSYRAHRGLLLGHLLGAVLALAGTHLLLVGLGVVLSTMSGWQLERRSGRLPGWPVALPLGLAGLIATLGLLAYLAGDTSLSLASLGDGPFSPAFELTGAGLLLATLWPLVGWWPLHRACAGPLTPIAAAALIPRVVAPLFPEGLAHWQPAVYPILVLGAGFAALARRDALLLAGLAGLGLLSGQPTAGWVGVILLGISRAAAWLTQHDIPAPRALATGRILMLLTAGLLLPVLAAGLQAQAFYTVSLVVAALVALLRPAGREVAPGGAAQAAPGAEGH